MLKVLSRSVRYTALLGAGALVMMLLSFRAQAQTCNTTYSGCAPCKSGYLSEQWCWTGASIPRPYATILMWDPNALNYVYKTCQATHNLAPKTTCEPSQPSDSNRRNVYRFFLENTKDHFLTMSWSEGTAAGGKYEGVAFTVYLNPIDANMRPLYRCYWPGASDHLVSTQSDCEGLTFEGTYGYVSSIERPGFTALYRMWMPDWTNHLSTTNPNEANSGVHIEGVQGYVPQ